MSDTVYITMNTCPYCQHDNREGVLVCEYCGRSVSIFANLPTRVMPDESTPVTPRWKGTNHFTTDTRVVLHLDSAREPLVLPLNQPTRIGRTNTAENQYPDVDLTPYGAFASGVSSHHVQLERHEDYLMLTDLGSTNGTYLNGTRVQPHQAVAVHDGAEVRLGRLVMHLYFESTACTPRQGAGR
ncbi:MAG: FHA domain-containing protein [Anaerolineae bacterium]|nr:FHA domain-containing protein [Anaerolineae bacterium]